MRKKKYKVIVHGPNVLTYFKITSPDIGAKMERKITDEKITLEIRRGKLGLTSGCKLSNGDHLVLTANVLAHPSIAIYTQAQWHILSKQIMESGHPALQRYAMGHADQCIVEAGKITLFKGLRDLADLHSEALWIRRETRIEIWSPKKYEEWRRSEEASNNASRQGAGLLSSLPF